MKIEGKGRELEVMDCRQINLTKYKPRMYRMVKRTNELENIPTRT
jgi:hypothetical protein